MLIRKSEAARNNSLQTNSFVSLMNLWVDTSLQNCLSMRFISMFLNFKQPPHNVKAPSNKICEDFYMI